MAAQLNGEPVDGADLQTLALVNYAHFTSMRVEDGRVRGLALHLERLTRDCRTVFSAELDTDRVRELVRQVVDGASDPVIVRVTVFDPALEMGHPGADAAPQILVTARAAAAMSMAPLRVATARFSRELPQVKHTGLMTSLQQRRLAQRAGFDDAVFVDDAGFISEGVTWNIGFIDKDQVVWPTGEVLPGVTAALIAQCHNASVSARVNAAELHGLQAAFATNVSYGARPIAAIDDVKFDAEHPLLGKLLNAYLQIPGDPL